MVYTPQSRTPSHDRTRPPCHLASHTHQPLPPPRLSLQGPTPAGGWQLPHGAPPPRGAVLATQAGGLGGGYGGGGGGYGGSVTIPLSQLALDAVGAKRAACLCA